MVDASTIVSDTMDALVKDFGKKTETMALANALDRMDQNRRLELIKEVLMPYAGNLMVTPKGIDTFIEDMALVIADGLNGALHPRAREQEQEK